MFATIRCLAAAVLGAAMLAPAATAQTTVTLLHDNDEWGGKPTDWEYSEGTRLIVMSPQMARSGVAQAAAHMLPGIGPDAELSAGLSLGHAYYAPNTISTPLPNRFRRPYAGYLYGSALLNAETGGALTSWRLDAGIIGPSAQSEELVRFFHDIFDGLEQRGWDTQIRDRLALNAAFERRWRNVLPLAGPLELDLQPGLGLEVGTVSIAANAGAMLRLGTGLRDDFGPPRAGAFAGSLSSKSRSFSGYAFVSALGTWAVYDVFLDELGGKPGDIRRSGSDISRDRGRTQTSFGVVLTVDRLRLSAALTDASKTYDQQADAERFAEFTGAWRF